MFDRDEVDELKERAEALDEAADELEEKRDRAQEVLDALTEAQDTVEGLNTVDCLPPLHRALDEVCGVLQHAIELAEDELAGREAAADRARELSDDAAQEADEAEEAMNDEIAAQLHPDE